MEDTQKVMIAFLSARLDEWERLAQQAYPVQTGSRDEGQPPEHVSWRRGPGSVEFGLRQVQAVRRVISWYDVASAMPDPHAGYTRGVDEGYLQACRDIIREFAAVFSGHRDYRPEWKP